ncbi:hypothetical protein NST83_25075 [Paenibacillus sp. FSL R10-2782]|uniref:hypothetical protein n=1 Tax=Paenibacillus sp. FSL R10-2782 TaxID=2954661 RepID=UPI00315808AA
MKSQLRNITVVGYAFVYWYSGGSRFILNLSSKENKNIKITLVFQANPPAPRETLECTCENPCPARSLSDLRQKNLPLLMIRFSLTSLSAKLLKELHLSALLAISI